MTVVSDPAQMFGATTSPVPGHAGMRSIARSLTSSISRARASRGAAAHGHLDTADAALARLVELVGGHLTPAPELASGGSAASHRDLLVSSLSRDLERIERLVEVYAGDRRLTAWQRHRDGRTSIAGLSARVGLGIRVLRESLGPAEELGPAQDTPQDTPQAAAAAIGAETFAEDWSPTAGPEADAFARTMRQTHCVFAARSTVWTAPWHGPDIADALGPWSRALRGFVEAARREPLDGFLLALPAEFGDTVDRLAGTTRRVLEGLAARDRRGRCELRNPQRRGWHFAFGGERLFAVTMAPCYPADHSRYSFGEPYTFILLQPDRAFDRAVSPGSEGVISEAVRSRIRSRYTENGRAYDLSITLAPYEAFRFVKPLRLGEAPVHWWLSERAPARQNPGRER